MVGPKINHFDVEGDVAPLENLGQNSFGSKTVNKLLTEELAARKEQEEQIEADLIAQGIDFLEKEKKRKAARTDAASAASAGEEGNVAKKAKTPLSVLKLGLETKIVQTCTAWDSWLTSLEDKYKREAAWAAELECQNDGEYKEKCEAVDAAILLVKTKIDEAKVKMTEFLETGKKSTDENEFLGIYSQIDTLIAAMRNNKDEKTTAENNSRRSKTS